MADLPVIVQRITADISQFESAIDQATSKLRSAGAKMESIGKELSLKVTAPITAALGLSTKLFGEQERQEMILAHLLKQTGAESWATAEGIKNLARAIQRATGHGDEFILQGANILLTFRAVKNAGEGAAAIFDRALRAMPDIAEVMGGGSDWETGGGMLSAARQLGKALEDPVTGLTALRRSGVSFSAEQRKHIEQLVESGRLLEAQMIVLDAIEAQLAGASEAAGRSMSGMLRRLKSEWGDAMEAIGRGTKPLLRPIIPVLDQIGIMIQRIPAPVLTAAAAFGMLVASIGPAMFFGGKLLKSIEWLGSGGVRAINRLTQMVLMGIPANRAQVKAVEALQFALFGTHAPARGLAAIWQGIRASIGQAIMAVRQFAVALWQLLISQPYLLAIAAAIMVIVGAIITVVAFLGWAYQHVEAFRQTWDRLVAAVKAAWVAIVKIIIVAWTAAIKPVFDAFVHWLTKLAEDFARWVEEHREQIKKWVSYIGAAFTEFVQLLVDVVWPNVKQVFGGLFHILRGIAGLLIDIVQAVWKFGEGLAKAAKGNLKGAWDALKGAGGELWHLKDDIAQTVEGVADVLTAPINQAANLTVWFSGLKDRFKATAREIGLAFDQAWDSVAKKSQEAAEESKDSWQEAVPSPEEAAKKVEKEAKTKRAPEVKPPKVKAPEIPTPPTPAIDKAAGNIARAADHLSDAADKQGQTAEELRRVLLSRSGIMQIIGGVVQRQSEESVLAALHEISGGIRR